MRHTLTWNEPTTGSPWWSKERLASCLIDRQMTYEETAKELGCHPETAKKWAKRHGVVEGKYEARAPEWEQE